MIYAPFFYLFQLMRKLIVLLLLLNCFRVVASSTVKNIVKPKYRLVWNEKFKRKGIDNKSWTKIARKSDVGWRQSMTDADSLYIVKNGNLTLRGQLNTNSQDTSRYVTAGLYTKHKRTIRYGKVEVRARVKSVNGAGPAIWLKPDDDSVTYPWGGEIDIMEHLKHDSIIYQTVHSYYTLRLGKTKEPVSGRTHSIEKDGFNTYAVELLPDSIVFSVNGDRYFTYPRINTNLKGQWPFDRDYYLLLSLRLGGTWVGNVDEKELPAEMEIDWVKFYELKE